ncbi:MAG: flippase-like domain-containing protein [Bacteroidetes bacterium]|nr:flippase-like domain-containing protein [Bacteroidota bacterium]
MQHTKKAIRYAVMLLVTLLLLWFSLRGLQVEGENKFEYLWNAWKQSDKIYLWLMALASLGSHLIRAQRWKMLLQPAGHTIKLSNGFWSLMNGYLVNLVVPRGGELSRCYTLFQLEKTPVETSFGTVVTERIADVVCLLVLIAFSFFMEWEKLKGFLKTLDFNSGKDMDVPGWIWVALVAVVLLFVAFYFLRKNPRLTKIIEGFKEGMFSIFQLENKWLFVFYSLSIWLLYFVMSYLVLLAFPETAHLGFSAVVTLFAIGSIAMAAPLPGGAGSYHVLVPLGLTTLYHISKPDAVAFVFVFHAWQTLLMIVLGVISLVVSSTIVSRKT